MKSVDLEDPPIPEKMAPNTISSNTGNIILKKSPDRLLIQFLVTALKIVKALIP
jgi:hypothetical protein